MSKGVDPGPRWLQQYGRSRVIAAQMVVQPGPHDPRHTDAERQAASRARVERLLADPAFAPHYPPAPEEAV